MTHLLHLVQAAMGQDEFYLKVLTSLSFFRHQDITYQMLMTVVEELDPAKVSENEF